MNYMSEVAKMLGVELEEEFEVCWQDNPMWHTYAMLTNKGIKITHSDLTIFSSSDILEWILCGMAPIKLKPWKPKYYEKYYSIGADGLEPGTWMNDFIDDTLYKIGNCYRTEEEARADSDKWKAFYASDEVLEV